MKRYLNIIFFILVLSCVSCSRNTEKLQIGSINKKDLCNGVYHGSYFRFPNRAAVDVTIEDHEITDIRLTSHFEGMGKKAEVPTVERIIEKQSTNVDAVTGATNSSYTIMYAVQDAVNKSYKSNK